VSEDAWFVAGLLAVIAVVVAVVVVGLIVAGVQ
jgi:hypothetical protein